jgi:2-polyprenyl-6-methoxyphenol hydroxylase-like FAD-dependent oxidoreductase
MNILVAGAGQIGSLLAQMLAAGGHKVHLVDGVGLWAAPFRHPGGHCEQYGDGH